jgi:hypothetical protein
MGVGLVQVVE